MERDDARPQTPPDGRSRDGAFAPTRLTSARPPVELWLVVALIALAAAVVKPWATEPAGGGPGGAVTTSAMAPRSSPSGSATVRPDSAGPLVTLFCLDPGSWRIATVERWRDQTIRVWRAIEPIATASGPNDKDIPVFPIVSEGVTELGWCAPVVGRDRPVGQATIKAWRRTSAGIVAIRTMGSRPTDVGLPFGDLYTPPGGAEVWRDGIYVFRYREATGRERWFAVEVELRASTGTID